VKDGFTGVSVLNASWLVYSLSNENGIVLTSGGAGDFSVYYTLHRKENEMTLLSQ